MRDHTTAEALPDWLEHYLRVPAWVLYKSVPENQILWVNESIARDMGKGREWFVGRSASEVWMDSRAESPRQDQRAVDENRTIDAISFGRDLNGDWRWLDARLTPIGKRRVLIICDDITARIRLAGLRLVLGRGVAGEPRGRFGESFARRLLEGASLDEICAAEKMEPAEVLGKLGRIVAEQSPPGEGIPIPAPADASARDADLPDWLSFYSNLPGPAIFLTYPELTVLWVNHFVLERNGVRQEDVVGIDAHEVWADVKNLREVVDRAMHERRTIDTFSQGHNLRGRQQWTIVRTTPVNRDRLLLLGENVTADIQLQALRLLLGLNPAGSAAPAKISEAFARLLLDGASVANICAALELSPDEVLGQASLVMGDRAG
jgi:PAS domain S-box-containing protein